MHNLSDGKRILQLPLDVGTITGCSGRRKDEEVPLLLIANEIFSFFNYLFCKKFVQVLCSKH